MEKSLLPIKRLLKKRDTADYYAGLGKWSGNIGEAQDFQSIREVLEEMKRQGLNDCCFIVLKFDNEQFDVRLPV